MTVIVDGVPATLPWLRTLRSDGSIGWYQRSRYDCMRAAVATYMQIRYDDIGDDLTNTDRLYQWAAACGLRVRIHDELPDGPWIGVSPAGDDGLRHTVVGNGSRVVFDPASGWVFPGGLRADPLCELAYVLTLEAEAPC